MKKRLLVLGMITCIFGLTGCGSEEPEKTLLSEADAIQVAQQCVQMTIDLAATGQAQQLEGTEYEFYLDAVESYNNASEDIGDYVGIISSETDIEEDSAIINVTIEGTEHNAIVEVILGEKTIESITTNVIYSFGESMEKAALNTLLGMGTVFVVLILICFIISAFRLINVLENRKKNTEKKAEEVKPAAPQAVPAAAAVQAEETADLTDDYELVAVIAAAIAASEGAAGTDGFVVRSIRKANKNKWQKA